MPIFTFPSTIYTGPVITSPYKADEIECTLDPPNAAHPGTWRATLKLSVFSQAGLSSGHASITLPRCTISTPVNVPATINPAAGFSLVAKSVTWTFASLAVNTVHAFFADFTVETAGVQLSPSFDVGASDLASPVNQVLTFTP